MIKPIPSTGSPACRRTIAKVTETDARETAVPIEAKVAVRTTARQSAVCQGDIIRLRYEDSCHTLHDSRAVHIDGGSQRYRK